MDEKITNFILRVGNAPLLDVFLLHMTKLPRSISVLKINLILPSLVQVTDLLLYFGTSDYNYYF